MQDRLVYFPNGVSCFFVLPATLCTQPNPQPAVPCIHPPPTPTPTPISRCSFLMYLPKDLHDAKVSKDASCEVGLVMDLVMESVVWPAGWLAGWLAAGLRLCIGATVC